MTTTLRELFDKIARFWADLVTGTCRLTLATATTRLTALTAATNNDRLSVSVLS
jgi:hypothetical protein